MKRSLLCAGVLVVMLTAVSFADVNEPNTPEELEDRVAELEGRVEELEQLEDQVEELKQRIDQLEDDGSEDTSDNNSTGERSARRAQPDADREALRIERANKKLDAARDAVKLARNKISSLPSTYGKSLEDKLEIVKDKWQLFANLERNLSSIVYIAKRNSDLGIDVIAAKRELDECRGDKKNAEMEKQDLRKRISDSKRKK
ncbi:MAG: hypothetical protein PHY02_06390 [Phycisphaerae bacterium]|nr:hypothetical protein [Phycisphaerae bacterium]